MVRGFFVISGFVMFCGIAAVLGGMFMMVSGASSTASFSAEYGPAKSVNATSPVVVLGGDPLRPLSPRGAATPPQWRAGTKLQT
ncbi:MAG: hypothetical protein WB760_17620 [Xanthobacteraceae bacterium]